MVTRWTNSMIFYWNSHMIEAWAVGCPCYLRLYLLFAADFSIAFFFSAVQRAYRGYEKKVFRCIKLQAGMPARLHWPLTGRHPFMFFSHPEYFIPGSYAGGYRWLQCTQYISEILQNVKARYSDQNAEKLATTCHNQPCFFLFNIYMQNTLFSQISDLYAYSSCPHPYFPADPILTLTFS